MWDPIGPRLQKKLNLTHEFSRLCKIQVIIGSICQIYNEVHSKFHLRFGRYVCFFSFEIDQLCGNISKLIFLQSSPARNDWVSNNEAIELSKLLGGR